MEKTTVTFQGENSDKKAVVTIEEQGNELEIKVTFEPEICAKEKPGLYAHLAMEFVKLMTGE